MVTTIGVAGITGKFGKCLVTNLLKNSSVNIRGYCRDASKVEKAFTSSPQVQIIQGNAFDTDSIHKFVEGCSVIVCCYLGDDKLMVDGQKALIDACEEAGVPRYIASDYALDYTKLEFGQIWIKDPIKHVKAYIESKEHVKGVHVLIGGFMEPVFSPFFNIVDTKSNTFRYWGEGDEPMEGTTYDNAAEFTAAVALDENAIGIQKFLGGRASIKQIAESYEKVYKMKPTLERLGSLDDLYNRMHAAKAETPANVYAYISLFFYYYWINGQTFVGPETDAEKYPNVKPVSWEEFMFKTPLEQLSEGYGAL